MKSQKIFFLSFFLIISDLVSKYFFYDLDVWSSLPFITKAFNTGISFSFPIPRTITILISLFALAIMFFFLKKKIISPTVFIFVFAGTVGNLIDRIRLWWVRDFIHIGWFPIFNLADSFLSLWAALFFLEEILKNKWTTKPKNI